MNGVKVKTINYDSLSNFFAKHISKEVLIREILSTKFSNSFGHHLTNSQFISVKKDFCEILKSNELNNLACYISDLKKQIAINSLLKMTELTHSSAPMLGLMSEIYSVLSLFASYARKTGLEIKQILLVHEKDYKDFIQANAIETNGVCRSITHLIDWDSYIKNVCIMLPTVELNLSRTFFVNGTFRPHYNNPLTSRTYGVFEGQKNKNQENKTISINEFLKTLDNKNLSSSNFIPKEIKNPFGRQKKYIVYSHLDNSNLPKKDQNKPVEFSSIQENVPLEESEHGFELNLGDIEGILPPKKTQIGKDQNSIEMQKSFNGLNKIKV